MTHPAHTPDTPAVSLQPPQSIARDIKAGLMGLGIAVGCLFLIIPVIHFVAIASGPAVGGFFASARIKARGWHTVVIGSTIGVGEAVVVAIVATCLVAFRIVATDKASMLIATGAAIIALFYATGLGSLGAYFGGRGDM